MQFGDTADWKSALLWLRFSRVMPLHICDEIAEIIVVGFDLLAAIYFLEMTSDLDLLGRYARQNSQDAFGEIVRRHLSLVYSAARRHVHSPQLAEEIAQSVFADLARVAATPSSPFGNSSTTASLAPWLYAVTRRTAIDVIRKESRRQLREQIAVEMTNMNANSGAGFQPAWSEIEPLLDDAMAALDDTDRSAVLLRYFENKSLREVGDAFGASEDAAQKRVSRAVEQLREFFSKRNVTIGASGLAVLISANAVQSAPIGLAATISAAAVLAGTAVHTSTVIAATKAIAMTTLQKTLVTATVAVLAGAGIYEARQASQMREQNLTLQQQQAPLAEQVRQLQRERDDATNRWGGLLAENSRLKSNPNQTELLKLRAEVTRLRSSTNATIHNGDTNGPMEAEITFWLARVEKLKEKLQQSPDKQIPEFQFITEQSWMFSSQVVDTAFDSAIRLAQGCAKRDFANALYEAIQKYMAGNNGIFPSDFSHIQPYFDKTVDPYVFQRYEIVQAELDAEIITNSLPSGKSVQFVYRPPGFGGTNPKSVERVVMEKAPLYEGDARIVVSKTGVQLQRF